MKKICIILILVYFYTCKSHKIEEKSNKQNIYSKYNYIEQYDTIIDNNRIFKFDIMLGFQFKGYLFEENGNMIYSPDLNERVDIVNEYIINKSKERNINKCNIKQIKCISSIVKEDDILYLIKIDFINNELEDEKRTNKYFILSRKYGIIGVYSTLEEKLFKGVGVIFTFERIG